MLCLTRISLDLLRKKPAFQEGLQIAASPRLWAPYICALCLRPTLGSPDHGLRLPFCLPSVPPWGQGTETSVSNVARCHLPPHGEREATWADLTHKPCKSRALSEA